MAVVKENLMHMRRRQIPAGLKGFLLRDVIRRKEFRDDKVSSSAKRWGRRGKQVKYGKEEIFFDKAAAATDDALTAARQQQRARRTKVNLASKGKKEKAGARNNINKSVFYIHYVNRRNQYHIQHEAYTFSSSVSLSPSPFVRS